MTIIEAVLEVMRRAGRPISPHDVLEEIERGKLYDFRARDPAGIVRAQMRRHSVECPAGSASAVLYLKLSGNDSYELLPVPIKRTSDRPIA